MKKETSICKIHKENNIVHLEFNESAILKHAGLNEIYEYIHEVYGKTDLPKLIDVRADLVIEDNGKQFFKDLPKKSQPAIQALLTGKNTNPEILDVFIRMNSEQTPLRIFTDYESAVIWLSTGFQN